MTIMIEAKCITVLLHMSLNWPQEQIFCCILNFIFPYFWLVWLRCEKQILILNTFLNAALLAEMETAG